MPLREWPVRWWLASLVAGVALPLSILLTVVLVDQTRREQKEARESALRIAQSMSARLTVLHKESLLLTERMAARPAIHDFDGTHCDSLFAIVDFFPQYLGLTLFDANDNAVCSATPAPEDARLSAAVHVRIADALRRGALRPREPVSESVMDHWISVVALPVSGRFHGTLVLAALPEVFGRETLPHGTVVTVLDQQGTIVARTDDAQKWVGRNVQRSELAMIGTRLRQGHAETRGVDGVLRLYGFSSVPDLNWSIYVGVPMETVTAPERQSLRRIWLGGFAIVTVLAVAAILMSRAITRPIQALVRAAELVTRGAHGRVTASGPKELELMAHSFNEMVDSRERAERQSQETESELKALSERLLNVQEQERTRIAREIHDDLGQAITALKMDVLGILEQSPTVSPALRERVPDTLDELVRSVQRIAAELRPSILDDLGLAAAIESEARSFEERTGIECEVSLADGNDAAPQLQGSAATAIYRIIQESLTNVARHSAATRVELRVRFRGAEALVEVRDDGGGITSQEIGSVRSLGLIGIRERAAMVGGSARFEGIAGRGTIVSVRIPLAEGEARD
jgi:signal transduction histidine kinase